MTFLMAFLVSLSVHATVDLHVTAVEYIQPADLGSCGLLRAREAERKKVIRELIHLNRLAKKGRTSALLLANHLLVNKLFMPNETWRDLNAEVVVRATIPDEMKKEIERLGLGHVFLLTRAPGFVWQSFIYQLPPEMEIAIDPTSGSLIVRYYTYLTVLCEPNSPPPRLTWIPDGEAPSRPNSSELISELLPVIHK